MKAIIILAHGSRAEHSNREFITLSSNIAKATSNAHLHVTYAFLEIASPLLKERISALHVKGYREFEIYPYFLNAGVHISRDIPNSLETFHETYSDSTFKQLEYFGKSEQIIEIIAEAIKQT